MVIFTVFFALGVWLLQQQAALPDFGWAWLLLGFPILLALPLLGSLSLWKAPLLNPLPQAGEEANEKGSLQSLLERGYFSRFTFPVSRAFLLAAFACGIGLYHATWQAEYRLAIALPDEWQGRDI